MSSNVVSVQDPAPRQALASQSNGFANSSGSTTWESQGPYENEQTHRPVNGLQNNASGDMSALGSERDSVMDYSNKKAPQAAKAKAPKKPVKGGKADPGWNAMEHDQNNWIHRDKLKEIEIREMEELGFRVGRASRSNSRSQSATRKPRVRTDSDSTDRTHNDEERPEPRRAVSPTSGEDEEALLQDEQSRSPQLPQALRPGTSRIPLPGHSGIPVPASVADRDVPLPRSRTGSTHMGGDAIAAAGARVRASSFSSQLLLDDPQESRETSPRPKGHTRNASSSGSGSSPRSSAKTKTPGKPAPTAKTRKTSTQRSGSKNRLASSTSITKRPGTSSGTVPRSTHNRPEGDAPWLATMYKPDPRLPPDQQIIPTHAKKMQQEQWESEGKVAPVYDEDFLPLNTNDPGEKRVSQPMAINTEKAQQYEEWPLATPTKQHSHEKIDSKMSKTSSAEQPGYKLTPTIPQSPPAPSPQPAPARPASPPKLTTTRLPEPVEDVKEKKKSACCIVM